MIADVKVVEQDNKTKAPATDTVSETKKTEDSNKATGLPAKVEAEKPVPAVKQESKETKPETAQPQKPVQEKTEISKTAETKVTQPDNKPGVTAAENKNETATSLAQPVLQHKPVRLSRFGVAKEFTTHNTTVGAVLHRKWQSIWMAVRCILRWKQKSRTAWSSTCWHGNLSFRRKRWKYPSGQR